MPFYAWSPARFDRSQPNNEGETTEIFVPRVNIFRDGMDELLGGTECDPSLPLEITFTGECAQDLAGPRKEFLGAMIRNIKDKLFVANQEDSTFNLHNDIVEFYTENSRHYYGPGLIFGKISYMHFKHCIFYLRPTTIFLS